MPPAAAPSSSPALLRSGLALALAGLLLGVAPGQAQSPEPVDPPPGSVHLDLSPGERAWREAHPRIRVAFDPHFPPYSFLDGDGELEGFAVDMLALLARRAGLEIEIMPPVPWEQLYRQAQAREVDVVATMVERPERRAWWSFTDPYIHKSLVIATRDDDHRVQERDDLAGQRVALVEGYHSTQRVLGEYPTIEPVVVDTLLDALNAVSTGAADSTVAFAGATRHIQTRYQIANLRLAAVYDVDAAAESIAVRKDWPELQAILQKGLDSIDESERARIAERWAVADFEVGVDHRLLLRVTAIFLLVLGAALLWTLQARRRARATRLARDEALQAQQAAERTNRALLRSEAQMRAVLDATAESIITTDAEGIVLSVNPATERTFGYTAEELLGQPVARLMSHEHRAALDAHLDHYFRVGESDLFGTGRELVARHKDGREFPVELSLGEIEHADQRQFTAIVRDVSEQRRYQERLEGQARELEQASEAAHAASRLKSEFLANMSHELRTPLNGILGFARLLRDAEAGPINDAQREFLDHVLASSEHLLQLINDVLDLSKVEAGKLEFHPEPIDPQTVVEEVCGIVRELAASKRLTLETEVDAAIGSIVLDPARLKQILYNYISNAIKFTEAGGGVRVTVRPDAGERIRLEVSDTGVGISPEDLSRLFVEFQQLDGGANKAQQGTGLGLALTQRLVEAQGGEVGVESTLGVGSTFHATLPAIPAPPGDGSVPESGTRGSAPGLAQARHILVVEDEPKERAWLERVLGEAGHRIDAVSTGATAIARAHTQPYDAITLDVFLSDMTGWHVLEEIRASGPNRETPVIVITVVADPSVSVGGRIHSFLEKPVSDEDLVAALERVDVEAHEDHPVLVVDDDPTARRQATEALSAHGFRVLVAPDGESGLDAARMHRPAAVLLDHRLPKLDSRAFLRRFRQLEDGPRTPVLLWSARAISDEERAGLQASVQAMVLKGAGATEHLLAVLDAEFRGLA